MRTVEKTATANGILVICTALGLALTPRPAAAAPDFEAPYREFSDGVVEVVTMATGDFDEDGLLDAILSIDVPVIDLVFMRQNPDHTFSNAGSWGASDMLHEIAVGDFDADGNLDVAGVTYADELHVYYGDGAGGTSRNFVTWGLPQTNSIERANLDGINGDDLVLGSYNWSQLGTFRSVADTLALATNYATLGYPAALGIGDVDGDGFDDIVTAHENIAASQILYANGSGGIASALTLSGSPFWGGAATVRDVNADGLADVLIGATDGTGVAVHLATGAATFATPSYYGGAVGSSTFDVGCGDLNGDNAPDLVLGGTDSYVLINSGVGTFTNPGSALPHGVQNFTELHLVDFDGDGLLDVMSSGGYGAGLLAARGHGDGTFGFDVRVPATWCNDALLTDMDGDGAADLVALSATSPQVDVLVRTGPEYISSWAEALADSPVDLAAGDFDGDGDADIATVTPWTGDVVVLAGDGLGGFSSQQTLGTGEYPTGVAWGDIDGDGLDDIVAVCSSGGESQLAPEAPAAPQAPLTNEGFSIHLSLGAGFAPPTFVSASGCPTDVVVADVTGDGTADLVGAFACSQEVVVFAGLGGGAFGTGLTLTTSGSPSALVVADLDGSNALDIVVLCTDGWLDRFLNVGAGAFAPGASVPTNYGGNDLVVAHLDGDGVLDAATRTSANVVAVHAGVPGGAFGPARGYGTLTGGSALLVEDYDGDADLDLLVAGYSHPELNLLRNVQGGGSSAVGDGPLFATGVLDMRHAAPNPASGGTQLEFRLGTAQRVAVDVFDLRGRLVRSLLAGRDLGEGSHVLHWDLTDRDGARVPSGVYLARVCAGEASATRKVFVTR